MLTLTCSLVSSPDISMGLQTVGIGTACEDCVCVCVCKKGFGLGDHSSKQAGNIPSVFAVLCLQANSLQSEDVV